MRLGPFLITKHWKWHPAGFRSYFRYARNLLSSGNREIIGQPLASFLAHGVELNSFQPGIFDAPHRQGEMQVVTMPGNAIFLEYSVNTNFLPGRHVAILRNVSQRKSTEKALQESDQRFQQMANNIGEIFWMVDVRTQELRYVSPAFETITGRSVNRERPHIRSYEELLHSEDCARVLSRIEDSARTGRFEEEFRIIRPDQSKRWVSVRGFPVRNSAGEIRRVVGTAQDITTRKSAEEQITNSLSMLNPQEPKPTHFEKQLLP